MGIGAIISGAGQVLGAATGFKNLLGLGGGNWEDQMEQQFQNEKKNYRDWETNTTRQWHKPTMRETNKCGIIQTSKTKGHTWKTQG